MDIQAHFLIKYFERFLTEKDAKEKTSRTPSKRKVTMLQYHIWEVTLDVSQFSKNIKNKIDVNIVPI